MRLQIACACGWCSAWMESPNSRTLTEEIVRHQREAHPVVPMAVTVSEFTGA